MSQKPLMPSPMTAEREAVMRTRAAAGQPVAIADDNAGVSASIQSRDRQAAAKRRNGHPQSEARFTDDGDEIDRIDNVWAAIDRYLSARVGTRESSRLARAAAADWRRRFRS